MNENEIFQGCQWIALFMGWTPEKINTYILGRNGNMGKLAYNESMDLLMPVIENIEGLKPKEEGVEYQFSITGEKIAITKYDDGSGVCCFRNNEIGKSKLEPTFEVIAEFCKDYLQGR